MCEAVDTQSQTQTQNSQNVEWSQNTPLVPTVIWGRLYSTKLSLTEKHCWRSTDLKNPEYYGMF